MIIQNIDFFVFILVGIKWASWVYMLTYLTNSLFPNIISSKMFSSTLFYSLLWNPDHTDIRPVDVVWQQGKDSKCASLCMGFGYVEFMTSWRQRNEKGLMAPGFLFLWPAVFIPEGRRELPQGVPKQGCIECQQAGPSSIQFHFTHIYWTPTMCRYQCSGHPLSTCWQAGGEEAQINRR